MLQSFFDKVDHNWPTLAYNAFNQFGTKAGVRRPTLASTYLSGNFPVGVLKKIFQKRDFALLIVCCNQDSVCLTARIIPGGQLEK